LANVDCPREKRGGRPISVRESAHRGLAAEAPSFPPARAQAPPLAVQEKDRSDMGTDHHHDPHKLAPRRRGINRGGA
jgi:hypothetical protein